MTDEQFKELQRSINRKPSFIDIILATMLGASTILAVGNPFWNNKTGQPRILLMIAFYLSIQILSAVVFSLWKHYKMTGRVAFWLYKFFRLFKK